MMVFFVSSEVLLLLTGQKWKMEDGAIAAFHEGNSFFDSINAKESSVGSMVQNKIHKITF